MGIGQGCDAATFFIESDAVLDLDAKVRKVGTDGLQRINQGIVGHNAGPAPSQFDIRPLIYIYVPTRAQKSCRDE
ncbi:MAG: hypothetical protein ACJAVT_002381 [Yoonia sp.]